jgi:hypothetical protein
LCFISLQTFYERLQIYEFIFLEIEQLLNIVVVRYNLRHYDYPTIMKYIVFFPIIPTRLEFNFLTLFVRPIILAAASSFSKKKKTLFVRPFCLFTPKGPWRFTTQESISCLKQKNNDQLVHICV